MIAKKIQNRTIYDFDLFQMEPNMIAIIEICFPEIHPEIIVT